MYVAGRHPFSPCSLPIYQYKVLGYWWSYEITFAIFYIVISFTTLMIQTVSDSNISYVCGKPDKLHAFSKMEIFFNIFVLLPFVLWRFWFMKMRWLAAIHVPNPNSCTQLANDIHFLVIFTLFWILFLRWNLEVDCPTNSVKSINKALTFFSFTQDFRPIFSSKFPTFKIWNLFWESSKYCFHKFGPLNFPICGIWFVDCSFIACSSFKSCESYSKFIILQFSNNS